MVKTFKVALKGRFFYYDMRTRAVWEMSTKQNKYTNVPDSMNKYTCSQKQFQVYETFQGM